MAYKTIVPRATIGDSSWFTHDRFGMFIHWGTYSLAARHEWYKSRSMVSTEEYMKYFNHFDPDLYDPNIWADIAYEAGMKYFVITTKHHEGFCLWDSKYTDYKATNTPYGKDVLAPMVDAFRAKGLKTGFYHSLLDWYHPDYTVDSCHPMRENEEYIAQDPQRDMNKYREYLYNQSEELMTKFGKIDILWYDFSVHEKEGSRFASKSKDVWQSQKIIDMVRSHQPGILINDRLDIPQDIITPEQTMLKSCVKVDGQPVVWEACQTFSGSWGYYRDEYTWKSVDMLVQMLIDTVSKGGNLILNVGPNGRGEFDPRAVERLKGIGKWMRLHNRSIYGCTQAPDEFVTPKDCRLTYNPETNRMYIHLFAWPFKYLILEGFYGKIKYAQLLNDASEITYREIHPDETNKKPENYGDVIRQQSAIPYATILELPVAKPDVTVPVIELFLE